MPINSSISEAAKSSIQIKGFIFHIIEKEQDEPLYNDEVILDEAQTDFFIERIREACEGTQFVFLNVDAEIRQDCGALTDNVAGELVRTSKRLTSRFLIAHNNSMNNGVFITCVFSAVVLNERRRFVCLMKVDYSTVYEQKRRVKNGKQVVSLTRVINSLADSPKALQKWAIIDAGDTYSWDVVALQRNKSAAEKDTDAAISGYFKRFLQSEIKRNPSTLTKESVTACRDWAYKIDNIPDEMSRSSYKARAVSYFEANPNFDTESFLEHVLGQYVHEGMDEKLRGQRQRLRQTHKNHLREALSDLGIAGQVFESRPSSIPENTKKNKFKTHSGLLLEYKGDKGKHNLKIDFENGEHIITIRTTELEEII